MNFSATLDRVIGDRQHRAIVTVSVEPLSDLNAPTEIKLKDESDAYDEHFQAALSGAETASILGRPHVDKSLF